MQNIKKNISNILANIENIKKQNNITYPIDLIAVTKYQTPEEIAEVLGAGIFNLGESRQQDLAVKKALFPDPKIKWHFLGHLQTNKVKKVVELADMVQSVDSLYLLKKIDEECQKINKTMPILLEVNIAQESTKFGFSKSELMKILPQALTFSHIKIMGLMAMLPHSEDNELLRGYFKEIKNLYDEINLRYNIISILSMGMSNDYQLAIAEGSNMVRIGSKIFK
jgi:pyridoxal phosphate enzyme (YggS family)